LRRIAKTLRRVGALIFSARAHAASTRSAE
jgi:hypothetical protein